MLEMINTLFCALVFYIMYKGISEDKTAEMPLHIFMWVSALLTGANLVSFVASI
jgi:hypothetical protein